MITEKIFIDETEEKMYEKWPKYIGENGIRYKEIIGEKFGKLTILYRTLNTINGADDRARTTYVCSCDCGNIVSRLRDSLVQHKDKCTCGVCKDVKWRKISEIDNWNIIDNCIYDEGANKVQHSLVECKKCGYTFFPRTSYFRSKKPKCKVCSLAEKSGLVNYINKDFNNFKILSYRAEGNGTQEKPLWQIKCKLCGEITEKDTKYIKANQSCGCLRGCSVKDSIGQTYGRLTVISLLPKKNSNENQRALCSCECGGYTITAVENLRMGHTLSCGCLRKEKNAALTRLTLKSGDRFGKLTVEKFAGINSSQHTLWHCKCDCGTEIDVAGYLLKNGQVKSCGCLHSQGEEKIKKMLNEANIKFESEKTFDSCRFPDTHALGRFDFFIEEKYLLEYDGIQHFQYRQNADGTHSWNTKEQYEYTKAHDDFKNNWCKNNNITLIRIPYIALSKLTLEDLQLGSQFTYFEASNT